MDNEILIKKTQGFYNYLKIKQLRNKDIVAKTLADKSNVSNYVNGRVKPSENFITTFESCFDVVLEDYEKVVIPDKKERAIEDLNKIKHKSKRGSRLINDNELIPVSQYIVPIPGQAGLKKAFFAPDEYIEEHFEKEIVYVKPSERAVYHKIEVDGDSMPGIVDSGDWARCEDIPKLYWLDKGTFKPNKVYCLIHRTRGILFKRISKTFRDSITLSSDNIDKDEYPDEVFDLGEFSKILIVRVVEKRL